MVTNDPGKKEIPLKLKVQVDRIYTLTPQSIALKGIAGETIRQTLSLVPNEAFPFALKEINAKRGEYIKYLFQEIKVGNSVRYEVTVENTKTDPGIYFDTLFLKTDSERKPEIQVTVFGNVRKAPEQTALK